MKKITKALLLVLAVYAGVLLFLWGAQDFLLYQPNKTRPSLPKNAEIVSVQTHDGLELQGWYFEAKNSNGYTILFFHGNAGNIGSRVHTAKRYNAMGYHMLLAEYRGYGGNEGEPSERDFIKDGLAYFDYLMAEKSVPAEKIIIFGRSLGSGVAVAIAAHKQEAGVILEVPFSSVTDVARAHYPFVPFMNIFLCNRYHNDDLIDTIGSLVVMGVGGKDAVIPPEFGQKLFDLAVEPKALFIYPDAEHDTVYAHGFPQDADRFLRENVLE